MNIAYLITQFPPYVNAGIGRYAEAIHPHLVEEHDVEVMTINSGHLPIEESRGRLSIYRPMGRIMGPIFRRRRLNRTKRFDFLVMGLNIIVSNLRFFARIRKNHKTKPIDVVVIHDCTNFLCAMLCDWFLPIPLVFHIHTTEYSLAPKLSIKDPLRIMARIEKHLGAISRKVVTTSPEISQLLIDAAWEADKIEAVLLGNSLERILGAPDFDRAGLRVKAKELRRSYGIRDEEHLMLFVGRLDHQKGVFPLLEAMARAKSHLGGLKLLMVGEGQIERIREIIARDGLEELVQLSGRFVETKELLAYYEAADSCIFPSLYEPFGLVALEAMSFGKPVILGDGFSRVFLGDPHKPAVRYVKATDPDDIAAGIRELFGNPALQKMLGENACRLQAEAFNWRKTARQTLSVYAAAASPA